MKKDLERWDSSPRKKQKLQLLTVKNDVELLAIASMWSCGHGLNLVKVKVISVVSD